MAPVAFPASVVSALVWESLHALHDICAPKISNQPPKRSQVETYYISRARAGCACISLCFTPAAGLLEQAAKRVDHAVDVAMLVRAYGTENVVACLCSKARVFQPSAAGVLRESGDC